MTATAPRWIVTAVSALAVGVVAVAVGAGFNRSEIAPVSLPIMAERAVEMPDGKQLFVQKYEISVAEWSTCHEAGGCTLALRTRPNLSPETQPATGLSYMDVAEYLSWISERSGHDFRLPTTAEWSHMAEGVLPDEPNPIFTDPSMTWASAYLIEGGAPRALRSQGGYSTSAEGIADLDGSVWEWTQDCYAGIAEGIDPDRCPAFFVGGEHIAAMSYLVRDPARGGCAVGTPPAHLGMRLVSDDPWHAG